MEIFILRENPFIEISISENYFAIKNEANTLVGGKYEFSKMDSLRLDRRINWFVSFVGFIVALFTSTGTDLYKERDVLKFNYDKKPFAISLKGGNLDLTLEVVTKINQRIGKK